MDHTPVRTAYALLVPGFLLATPASERLFLFKTAEPTLHSVVHRRVPLCRSLRTGWKRNGMLRLLTSISRSVRGLVAGPLRQEYYV